GCTSTARQLQSRLSWRDAAAAHADVHFNENAQGSSGRAGRLAQRIQVVRIIDTNADTGTPRQPGQPAELERADDLVGDKDVLEPSVGEPFSLVELGAEEALHAAGRQVAGQPSALERLEVNADTYRPVAEGG